MEIEGGAKDKTLHVEIVLWGSSNKRKFMEEKMCTHSLLPCCDDEVKTVEHLIFCL